MLTISDLTASELGVRARAVDTFHVVLRFEYGDDDFVIHGVYSLSADAQAHADRLRTEPETASRPPFVVEWTRDQIAKHLIRCLIGPFLDSVGGRGKVTIVVDRNLEPNLAVAIAAGSPT